MILVREATCLDLDAPNSVISCKNKVFGRIEDMPLVLYFSNVSYSQQLN